MTVTNFSIEYDSVNSSNTFTNGDIINGRIIVEVSKQTTISSLVFIGKGEARVRWSEHYGQYYHHVYWQNEKYYEIKHHLLRESRQDGEVLKPLMFHTFQPVSWWWGDRSLHQAAYFCILLSPGTEVINKGRHVFPFSFQIPDRCLFLILFLSVLCSVFFLFIPHRCLWQKSPVNLQILHWQSSSQVEGRAEAVNETDQKDQNPLHICVQTGHGHSRTDGEKNPSFSSTTLHWSVFLLDQEITIWLCSRSCRNLSMAARINLSRCSDREMFLWMLTSSGWDTGKVIIHFNYTRLLDV